MYDLLMDNERLSQLSLSLKLFSMIGGVVGILLLLEWARRKKKTTREILLLLLCVITSAVVFYFVVISLWRVFWYS